MLDDTRKNEAPAVSSWPWVTAGLAAILLTFGAMGGWAATVPLASAIVAMGQLTVDTNRKEVQHLEGGIVDEVLVRNGDLVEPGDVLVRLDDTRARSSLAIVAASRREALAKEARYIAERDDRDEIRWPPALSEERDDPAVGKLLASQEVIFRSRRKAIDGEIEILNERILQLDEEIGGLDAQKLSSEQQIAFVSEELEALLPLLERGQTTKPRILTLERERARLKGLQGELVAGIARARNSIGETRLEILQKRLAFKAEVVSDLREIQAEVNDLDERYIAARDVLDRLDIVAPVEGKVVNLAVHGRNAVIRAGETILQLVPSADNLLAEIRISPKDVDNVAVGQSSEIKLLAFKQRLTPTLRGNVQYVSADSLANPQDGTTYFAVRVGLPESELSRLDGQVLQPGMPVQVMIKTGERTALAYFMQPVFDSMNRALREE